MMHTFHIPVLGTGYSIDTAIKVAPFGISSVASIGDDILQEKLRAFYSKKENLSYTPIDDTEPEFRSRRISAYLNMMHQLVLKKFEALKQESLSDGGQLCRYFDMLPDSAPIKHKYNEWQTMEPCTAKDALEKQMKQEMAIGAIDVNIMAKVDKLNLDKDGVVINSDALEALKGFAESSLESSVVLSAGLNPRLYSYLEQFDDFFANEDGAFRKKIILKVSDFRSALIQAKILAKKGIWVSELRIESGLNCGGHAFATDGYLLGPILEEFKTKRVELRTELNDLYKKALIEKRKFSDFEPQIKISVQGGIGTAAENIFLLDYYEMDATGWGSPFLLVPEAVNVDVATLSMLANAKPDDYYVSNASPLGVPFNNFRPSTAEQQRLERIAQGRPGSPCVKKYLVSNTEFTKEPICTASRKYQALKLKSLKAAGLDDEAYKIEAEKVTDKLCLCEGLVTSTYVVNDMQQRKNPTATAICPGPNLAYFSRSFSLDEMVSHIYGKVDLLLNVARPNMFVNELNLYVDYLKKSIETEAKNLMEKKANYFTKFKNQLEQGIQYYKELVPRLVSQTDEYRKKMIEELKEAEVRLSGLHFSVIVK